MRENANNHETESSDSDDSFDKYTTIKQKWLEDYRNESYGNDKWPVEDQTESAPQPTNVHAILKMVRESSTFTIETQRAISSVLNMSSAATPIPSQPKTNWFPNTMGQQYANTSTAHPHPSNLQMPPALMSNMLPQFQPPVLVNNIMTRIPTAVFNGNVPNNGNNFNHLNTNHSAYMNYGRQQQLVDPRLRPRPPQQQPPPPPPPPMNPGQRPTQKTWTNNQENSSLNQPTNSTSAVRAQPITRRRITMDHYRKKSMGIENYLDEEMQNGGTSKEKHKCDDKSVECSLQEIEPAFSPAESSETNSPPEYLKSIEIEVEAEAELNSASDSSKPKPNVIENECNILTTQESPTNEKTAEEIQEIVPDIEIQIEEKVVEKEVESDVELETEFEEINYDSESDDSDATVEFSYEQEISSRKNLQTQIELDAIVHDVPFPKIEVEIGIEEKETEHETPKESEEIQFEVIENSSVCEPNKCSREEVQIHETNEYDQHEIQNEKEDKEEEEEESNVQSNANTPDIVTTKVCSVYLENIDHLIKHYNRELTPPSSPLPLLPQSPSPVVPTSPAMSLSPISLSPSDNSPINGQPSIPYNGIEISDTEDENMEIFNQIQNKQNQCNDVIEISDSD